MAVRVSVDSLRRIDCFVSGRVICPAADELVTYFVSGSAADGLDHICFLEVLNSGTAPMNFCMNCPFLSGLRCR